MREERRLAFGSVADLYDRVRPTYPGELIDDAIAYAGIDASGEALEVGSGTGRATLLFAARGVAVHGLEPSAEMAAVARRACAEYDRVEIEQTDFEHFAGADGHFQLLFSAQAWHWVSPAVRYVRAREALAPGGGLALFWNRPDWRRSPHRNALLEAYQAVAPDFDAVGGYGPMHPADDGPAPRWGDWEQELQDAPGFGSPELRLYDWSTTYSAADYVELLRTHSDHMLLGEVERGALCDAVRQRIDRLGGSLQVDYVTALSLARAV